MLLVSSKLLKLDKKPKKVIYQESRLPQTRNRIYQRKITFGCKYCNLTQCGRKKHFKSLHLLYCHFHTHHGNEPRYKKLTMSLADLILDGTLL